MRQATPNDLKTLEQGLVASFNNQSKPDNQIGYGENFRPYTVDWINNIANNINLAQFDNLTYQPNRRAIAIENLAARVLPTNDVHFYNYKLAGQGYPFDNLQMSSLWIGTPVYILAETRDHAWVLVLTPDYIAWVKSRGIAQTNDTFINTWQAAAKNHMAAITRTQSSVLDAKGKFLFTAYVGAVFPADETANGIKMMVPVADANRNAVITNVIMPNTDATIMPLAITPHNLTNIMQTLLGRPYGWGGMYFYNDCSAELKSFFTPFGIWLPRHSADQVNAGKLVDMTSATATERLGYLMENGQRFLTLVYIGGHVMLYIGNYPNPNTTEHGLMIMTYQNIWGLSPSTGLRRAVIGQSVLFPMLAVYPEDDTLAPLTSKKYFQVSFLNKLPAINYQMQAPAFDLKSLMSANQN